MQVDFSDFLSKELTGIPQILSNNFGNLYSNAVCNGCTWLFIVWYILHSVLDYLLNEVLRKMKYKEYNRIRLKNSVWYLGFYCTVFVHTGASFFQNRPELLGMRKINTTIYEDTSSDLVMGFMVLFSFFLHSAFWEGIEHESKTMFFSYFLLCCVFFMSFVLRNLDVAFNLTGFISIAQVTTESAKLLFVVAKQDNSYFKMMIGAIFGLGVCFYFFSYLVGVPLIFLIPFFRKIVAAHISSGFIPLTLLIGGWYVSEIGNSLLFKLLGHWLFHTESSSECCGNLVECSLFPPRNDVAYNLFQLRKEIKEREERKLSLRRASKKGVLVQTIKCMVNLKRKIHAKKVAAAQENNSSNINELEENNEKLLEPEHEHDSSNKEMSIGEVDYNETDKTEEKNPIDESKNGSDVDSLEIEEIIE